MTGYSILGAAASTREAAVNSVQQVVPSGAAAEAVSYLKSLVGVTYVYGSKDPGYGLDCSGAVLVAYEHAGLAKSGARYKYGSADLHKKLDSTSSPSPGDLVFYGRGGDVSHVMLYVGDGQVVGATGGGPKTKTPDDARAIGAYVKVRPVDYRKDIVGYGRSPSVPLDGSASTRVSTSDTRMSAGVRLLLAAGAVAAGYYGYTRWT